MALNKLTTAKVRTACTGMHGDGGGLWLQVAGASRSWCLRYTFAGKVRQMGLGSAADVTLARARELAADARAMVVAGTDPIEARHATREAEVRDRTPAVTFEAAAVRYIDLHRAGWRNGASGGVGRSEAQWTSSLQTYAYPAIGNRAIAEIDTPAILAVLEPIWTAKKIETGRRVRGRIEAILDYAAVQGWRPRGFNPAVWRGNIAHALPSKAKAAPVQHHAALAWGETPAFMAALRQRGSIGAKALAFAILTAARSGEVRGAAWAEIDMQAAVWTVPAERMKGHRQHRVPLSDAAMAILREMAELRTGELVFPGARQNRPLSDMTMTAVLRRMGRSDLTAHGFRSTFRDWCAEATAWPRELAEAALAHVLADKTEAAYQRGDMFDKRRRLMDQWADYCAGVAGKAAAK